MRRALILGFCLLAPTACLRDSTPLEFTGEQLELHAVLQAGDSIAVVLLTRSLKDRIFEAVPGATVRLTWNGQTAVLSPEPPGRNRCTGNSRVAPGTPEQLREGCYVAAIAGGIRSGQSYALSVDLPGGRVVQGRATVPEPPRFLAPAAGTTVELPFRAQPAALVTVRWEAPRAPHLQLGVDALRPNCTVALSEAGDDFETLSLVLTGRDSIRFRGEDIVCNPGLPQTAASYPAALVLTAFDSAYARYLTALGEWDSVREPGTASGITGARGVFAGAASARLPVTLVIR